ncbi:DNA polymerase II large subunit, partial [Candidatus Micrarchaeota archaeon]|nr:DNA polymerase II large subunit [Candidatus Micrarchaeota archaeon]
MSELIAAREVNNYFNELKEKVNERFSIAKKAREKGLDVDREVESIPVSDLAERTEEIIGPKGVAKRFRELHKEEKGDREKVIFRLFKEIIEQKWCSIPNQSERIEQAIKTCLVIETEGVVVAPIDGVPKIIISKNPDGSRYVDVYFAGPIRAAGGSATVLPLILGDYARKLLDIDRYKPTDEEVERYVEEIMIYQTEIISRQYMVSEEEIRTIVRGCPVCVNGVPTEEREVSVHRDLERIPSNRIRGGMGLVISEGVALKAMKIMEWAKELNLDWNWLEKIVKVKKTGEAKNELKPIDKYLDRIAAGRPLLAYPMKYGGFRIRYGRSRNTGIMGKGINPATMIVLDEFIAVGTHIRIERPGKAAQLFPCDSIDGPIILLEDGEVIKLNSIEEAEKVKRRIKKILFLGDILITVGDFRKTAHPLVPSPYVEEWYKLELEKALEKGKKLNEKKREELLEKINSMDQFEAVELSLQLKVPLHPKYLHFYTALKEKELIELMKEARKAEKVFEKEKIVGVKFEDKEKVKELLERIGLPHKLEKGRIIVGEEFAYSFLKTIGTLSTKEVPKEINGNILDVLSEFSGMKIKDKAGTFIGARMGRPEQAKPREMKGNPHILFPIGLSGGNTRSINKAIESSSSERKPIKTEIGLYKCLKCNKKSFLPVCTECGEKTIKVNKCINCGRLTEKEKCEKCNGDTKGFEEQEIDLEKLSQKALKKLKVKMPEIVKGVKGLINESKEAEPLEKGILRAKHNVHIFRDATSRFELLNAPITHFKPKEIGMSVKKARELGYRKDAKGKELVKEEQVVELFPQDIIVNEGAGEWLVNVSKFIDELLERFYGMKAFYNAKIKEDLIGELVISLAPHTSAGIVGRVIGYTKSRVGWGHPYFIMCKRRNCLTGNTQVLLNSEQGLHLAEIGSLDKGGTCEEIPLEDTHTYAINKKGELKRERVTALLKQKAPKELYEIKTKYGRKITATKDHQMLIHEKNKVGKNKVGNLKVGDKLLSLLEFKPEKETKKIDVLEFYLKKPEEIKQKLRIHNAKKEVKEWVKKNGGCWKVAEKLDYRDYLKDPYKQGKAIHTAIDFDSIPLDLFEKIINKMGKNAFDFKNLLIGYNKQKSTIPTTIELNKEVGEIIGHYLAEGYCRTTDNQKRKKFVYQVNMVSAEKEITNRIKENIKRVFCREATIKKDGDLEYLTLSGRVYYDFFKEMLSAGTNAKNKQVPSQVLSSNKKCVEGALGLYITGDGSVDYNCVKTSSVNEGLTNGIGLLCNRLGIFPHFFEEKEREISSGYVKKFYEKKGIKKKIKSCGIRIYSTDLNRIRNGLIGNRKRKLIKLLKDDSKDNILIQSYWTASLISYVRCFSAGKRLGLSEDIFKNTKLEDDPLGCHHYFKNLRDKHIAHSVNPFEQIVVDLQLSNPKSKKREVLGVSILSQKLICTTVEGAETF